MYKSNVNRREDIDTGDRSYRKVVITVAYKGSGKKARVQGSGVRRSQAPSLLSMTNSWNNLGGKKSSTPRDAKRQTNKNHDTNRKGGGQYK